MVLCDRNEKSYLQDSSQIVCSKKTSIINKYYNVFIFVWKIPRFVRKLHIVFVDVLLTCLFPEHVDAEESYTAALRLCPVCYSKERSILFSNRAAARLHQVNYCCFLYRYRMYVSVFFSGEWVRCALSVCINLLKRCPLRTHSVCLQYCIACVFFFYRMLHCLHEMIYPFTSLYIVLKFMFTYNLQSKTLTSPPPFS